MLKNFKGFVFDLLFPKFCLNCQREGNYLCEDCQSTLSVLEAHQKNPTHPPAGGLKDLYFALSYQQPLIKNLIKLFKYQPFVKELAIPLTSLIIEHFQLLEKPPDFANFTPHHFPDNQVIHGNKFNQTEYPKSGAGFILVPVPSEKKKLKWRGFNQAEEIGKELSKFFGIPLITNCLIKIKETLPQVELSDEERRENIKGAFLVKDKELIKNPEGKPSASYGAGKKILLVDDVYTTGSTMEECARILKEAGAKEIIGIVVARG